MSIQDKLHPVDDFWNQEAQEKASVRRIDAEINNLKGAIALADKILTLKGNAGWLEFVKAVEDCRAYRRQELELSAASNDDLRILQGRCRELGAIMSLMTQTETNTQTLSGRLKGLVREREAFVMEDGKVKLQGVLS
jgi:hypothetical protein